MLWPLVLAIALVLALHIVSPGGPTEVLNDIRNSMHAPGFSALALLTFMLLRRTSTGLQLYLLTFSLTVSVSISGELLQLLADRSASVHDFAKGVMGIVSLLLIAAVFDASLPLGSKKVTRLAVLALGLVGLLSSFRPFVSQLTAVARRTYSAPVILNFEADWQSTFYKPLGGSLVDIVPTPNNWPVKGNQSLLLQVGTNRYSGLSIAPVPDWSAYTAFSFVVASADDKQPKITVRISDYQHNDEYNDRFNQTYVVTKSPRQISIPLTVVKSAPRDRSMRLNEIAWIAVFVSEPKGGEKLLFDDFLLEIR